MSSMHDRRMTVADAASLPLGPWAAAPGETIERHAGDVMTFPTGWAGEWTAHTRMRKLYCTFRPPGA